MLMGVPWSVCVSLVWMGVAWSVPENGASRLGVEDSWVYLRDSWVCLRLPGDGGPGLGFRVLGLGFRV